jgi:cyclopropane fatty-acyl-phospholipid synthase-like methyltransferase
MTSRKTSTMEGINQYWHQLSLDEIAEGKHREFVGGLWEKIGGLQFNFLSKEGLMPEHKLLDIGCGSLRGGVFFIRYLNEGNYCGLDLNASLIRAGKKELDSAGLINKQPKLLVNDKFEASRFGVKFDFALAMSVFTHLFMNHISRSLVEVRKVLQPHGRFYATFFEAPHSAHIDPITHTPGNVTTNFDVDPFHYSFEEVGALAHQSGLAV